MSHHEELLRQVLSELLEESRFEKLDDEDKAWIERTAERYEERGSVTPFQYALLLRVYRGIPRRVRKSSRKRLPMVNPAKMERLREKFGRIMQERGSLPAVKYRLARRDGPKGEPRGNPREISDEEWRRIRRRYRGYLERARRFGKDLSTPGKRQPYLMIAIRWELSDRDERLRAFRKGNRTKFQKLWYYDTMRVFDEQRLKETG